MSQLGCVTLAPKRSRPYMVANRSPQTSRRSMTRIPVSPMAAFENSALEPIAWMIEHQNRPVREVDESERTDMRLGAEILRLTLAYERLIHKGLSRTEAVHTLVAKTRL